MPIEIKELIIRVEVGNQRQPARNAAGPSGEDRRQLVQDCVDQVMEILKEKKER